MMDLSLDENFELEITPKNDLSTVSGEELFKQRLVTRLTLFQRRVLGSKNSPNAVRKVRSEVLGALRESDEIISVEQVDVEITEKNEIAVYIAFNKTEQLNETI